MRIFKFDTIKAIAMASVVLVHVYAGISFPKPVMFRRCFLTGGIGQRFGAGKPKQYFPILGKEMIVYHSHENIA